MLLSQSARLIWLLHALDEERSALHHIHLLVQALELGLSELWSSYEERCAVRRVQQTREAEAGGVREKTNETSNPLQRGLMLCER